MKTVNRFALIVRPSKPFIEWAARVFNEPVAKVGRELKGGEPSVYLLPESNAADANDPALLKSHWRQIFKEELEDWCTDKTKWPNHITESLFRAWFKIELCTIVYDTAKSKIEYEI